MRVLVVFLIASSMFAGFVQSADANAWRSRTVYQVLTDRFWRSNGDSSSGCNLRSYCGGDFTGLGQKLQYIKDLGFDAIWISPVVDNMDGGYHGYWFRNWEKVNDHFGTDESLKAFVDKAHSMGIWVMVDVVANHVAPIGEDFSKIYPLNQAYHYHKNCPINNWDDQWQVENCRLCDLPDLDQSNPWVRQYLKDWIKHHVQKFGFDGIRIDTVPHIEKSFWTEFTQYAGVFSIGEIFNGRESYVGGYQQVMDSTLNYPMYFTIKDVWMRGQSMRAISSRWGSLQSNFKNVDVLGLFVDNHDNARFLHDNGDWRVFKSALAFSLTARGIPFFYYGSEQGFNGGSDPENREAMWKSFNYNHEIFKFIQTLNRARQAANVPAQPFSEKWADDDFYAFTRGRFIVALTNRVNKQVSVKVPNLGMSDGTVVCNIYNGSDCGTIQGNSLQITLNNGEVKVYVPKTSTVFQTPVKGIKEILLTNNKRLQPLKQH